MIVHLSHTTSQEVDAKLLDLREEGGVVALGRVLTLVIITSADPEPAIAAANDASREHPCRVIVVARDRNDRPAGRLDAEIRVGADAGASEVVLLLPTGPATEDIDTLLTPLLLPDAPIVVWWPAEAPEVLAGGLLGHLSQRRISDVLQCTNPIGRLRSLAEHYAPGDTDLSWARTTLWRGLLAATFDTSPGPAHSAVVFGNASHPAVRLFAGWLRHALEAPVRVEHDAGATALTGVRVDQDRGPVRLDRPEGSTTLSITVPGVPAQHVALPLRDLAECLVEDLRRLDPDATYAAALAASQEVEIT